MTGGGLFHRLYLRFLAALALAIGLLLPIVHLAQLRALEGWQIDLKDQAAWLAHDLAPDADLPALAADWSRHHHHLRLSLFDAASTPVADSEPDDPPPELERAKLRGRRGYVGGAAERPGGGWVVLTRPSGGAFPRGYTAEFTGAMVAALVLVALLLYPFVRSLGTAFSRMTEVAGEVAAGNYGRSVGIERKDELGDLIAAFDRMSHRLADADRLQTRLLHDVSHELRSPLGRIQALAETLERHPEETAACVRGIEDEVALLGRLTEDLLDAARLESEPVAASLRALDLRVWTEETLSRLGATVRARGVAWSTRLPETSARVTGDPQRLAQAVANLVDNSLAALDGREGGRIEVRVEAGETEWRVEVEDDGPGIPPADLPHVFRRFYRVQEDRSRHSGGVGLGLSLVRAIVEAHGGTVSLESRPGAGTVARLRLPRDAA